MASHTIRLRRPWEKRLVGSDQVARVDVPETENDQYGSNCTFQYLRRFNRPTGLEDQSTVRLAVSEWSGRLDSITINGHQLPLGPGFLDVDVTNHLKPQNEISMQLSGTGDSAALLSGEVALVITPNDRRDS